MNEVELLESATKFREAIVKSNVFPNFPSGCCKHASWLLAKFLVEVKCFDPNSIAGFSTGENEIFRPFDGQQTHFWLKVGSINIDITACQFPEITKEPVIITTEWIWGEKFTRNGKYFSYSQMQLNGDLPDKYDSITNLLH